MKGKYIVSILIFTFFVSIGFAYPITGNVIKAETTTDAGITPDSFLYFLDTALDNINIALTFDSEDKTIKSLTVARERLMEVREMATQSKLDATTVAQQEHSNALEKVKLYTKSIESSNSTQEIKSQIRIQKEVEEHENEVEAIRGEIKVKIKIEGELTAEQMVLIESILSSLEGKVKEVELEIEDVKRGTKVKIKQETGKSNEEIEDDIEDLEEEQNLENLRQEKALDKIEDVEENLIESGNNTAAFDLLNKATTEYRLGNYQEAYRLAKQADDLIEEIDEREIEVEIKGNQSKVEIEINGTEAEFILDTVNRDEIVNEISQRTGLTTQEIEAILEIEAEEEIEIEAEIEDGTTTVKTEVNGKKIEFVLNTTDNGVILAEIQNRTGLDKTEIEKNIEFEIDDENEAESQEDDSDESDADTEDSSREADEEN